MKADFLDAHNRHRDDAELLFGKNRWANADHLLGLAAECGLKYLMVAFDMPIDGATGSPQNKDDKVHVNKIWERYESYLSGANYTKYYLPQDNLFKNWDVAQRYVHRKCITKTMAENHQKGTEIICALIKKATEEGII